MSYSFATNDGSKCPLFFVQFFSQRQTKFCIVALAAFIGKIEGSWLLIIGEIGKLQHRISPFLWPLTDALP